MLKHACAFAVIALGLAALPASAQAKDAIVIDLPGDAATLDPHVQWDTDSYTVYRNIFDNLVTRDDDGQDRAADRHGVALRRRHEIEFDIRTDVKFHDGTRADGRGRGVQRHSASSTRRSRARSSSQFNQIVVGATAEGRPRSCCTTKTPYPALLAQLVKLSIVPKAVCRERRRREVQPRADRQRPLPLASWQKGVQSTLEANDAYWRGKPPFKTRHLPARCRTSPRASPTCAPARPTSCAQLEPRRGDRAQERGAAAGSVGRRPSASATCSSTPWPARPRTSRVRRAIAHSIDQQALIEALLQGFGNPVNIMLTPANFGYVRRRQGLRATIRQGQGTGQGSRRGRRRHSPSSPRPPTTARGRGDPADDPGSRAEGGHRRRSTSRPSCAAARAGRRRPAASRIGRWSCACQDADGVIFPLFHTGSIWAKYSNPAFDEAVDAGPRRARRGQAPGATTARPSRS